MGDRKSTDLVVALLSKIEARCLETLDMIERYRDDRKKSPRRRAARPVAPTSRGKKSRR